MDKTSSCCRVLSGKDGGNVYNTIGENMTGKLNFKSSLDNKGKSISDTKLLCDVQRKPRFHHRNFTRGTRTFWKNSAFSPQGPGSKWRSREIILPTKKVPAWSVQLDISDGLSTRSILSGSSVNTLLFIVLWHVHMNYRRKHAMDRPTANSRPYWAFIVSWGTKSYLSQVKSGQFYLYSLKLHIILPQWTPSVLGPSISSKV